MGTELYKIDSLYFERFGVQILAASAKSKKVLVV